MTIEEAVRLAARYPVRAEALRNRQLGIDYYHNKTAIARGGTPLVEFAREWQRKQGVGPLRSADNRIPTNWHKILVDQKVGYLFTYPPRFDVKRDAGLVEQIDKTLGDGYEKVLKQLATDASNTGSAWLAYWYDEGRPFDYYFLSPLQVTPVYATDCIKPRLSALIRRYNAAGEDGKPVDHVEVWDDRAAVYFTGDGKDARQKPHNYGRIPFIEFCNNESRASDLDMYRQIIDAIDKVVSGLANDLDDIQEILFIIRGYAGERTRIDYVDRPDGTAEPVNREISPILKAKLQKYFLVDGDGGVDTLKAEIPFEARKAYLEMLEKLLYVAAMAVNPDPDRTGNQSGVYIEFLYSLLELKAGLMETEFRPAIGALIRAVLRYLGKPEDTEVAQIWTRNKPRNDVETAQILNGTPDTVMSSETKTQVHPLIEDWKEERKKIEKEQAEMFKQMETPPPRAGDAS